MAMRDQMAHIAEELQNMSALLKGLQETLLTKPFSDLPEPQRKLDPSDVILDKNTVLGGSKSVVYAGTLYELTEVAVKVVSLVDDRALMKVEDEVRRTMRARHRNVVRVIGIAVLDDDTVGIVMERLGVSLGAAKVTEAPTRMKYTLDIIAGMECMHSRGPRVVHFNLTTTNILLTQDKRLAKIIDFGVSRTVTTLGINPEPSSTRGTNPVHST
jgi:serine/threonine protein kinase